MIMISWRYKSKLTLNAYICIHIHILKPEYLRFKKKLISIYVIYETLDKKHIHNFPVPSTDFDKVQIFNGKFHLHF